MTLDPCPRCLVVYRERDEDGRQDVTWCRCGLLDSAVPDVPPPPISCIDGGRCEDYPACGCDDPGMIALG